MAEDELAGLSREEMLERLAQQAEVIGRQREELAEREAAIEPYILTRGGGAVPAIGHVFMIVRHIRPPTRTDPRAPGRRRAIVSGCEQPDTQADRPGPSTRWALSSEPGARDRHLLAACVTTACQTTASAAAPAPAA